MRARAHHLSPRIREHADAARERGVFTGRSGDAARSHLRRPGALCDAARVARAGRPRPQDGCAARHSHGPARGSGAPGPVRKQGPRRPAHRRRPHRAAARDPRLREEDRRSPGMAHPGPLRDPATRGARAAAAEDGVGSLLEGVRPHDEYKRAATLAADGVTLKPTGGRGTPLPDEDPDFVSLVWAQASKGTTPLACEAAIATDSYRTRRLLAHWLEEGSLIAA